MLAGLRDGGHVSMSAPSWFVAGLLAGAAVTFGAAVLWRASREAADRGRRILLAGGLIAAAAVASVGGMSFAINSRQGAAIPPGETSATDSLPAGMPSPPAMPSASAMPSAGVMPSAAVMSRILAMPRTSGARSAEPMDQAAANLAARLEREGGAAADWNLLAQAYDFLGRPEDAQRARARAAQARPIQPAR